MSTGALRTLVDAVRTSLSGSPAEALQTFAAAAAEVCNADAAIVRLAEVARGELTARAVYAISSTLAAELAGSRATGENGNGPLEYAFGASVELDGEAVGELELLRDGAPFGEAEQLLARVAADELALVLRALPSGPNGEVSRDRALVLAGEGLAAASDDANAAAHVARLAVDASGAEAALVWRAEGDEPRLEGAFGASAVAESAALSAARVALDLADLRAARTYRRCSGREPSARRACRRRPAARVRGRSGRATLSPG